MYVYELPRILLDCEENEPTQSYNFRFLESLEAAGWDREGEPSWSSGLRYYVKPHKCIFLEV